jgi:hypothetical protein
MSGEQTGPGRPIAGGEKRKDKRSDIVSETKPKRFGIVPEFVLLRTDCFDLVQNLLSFTK